MNKKIQKLLADIAKTMNGCPYYRDYAAWRNRIVESRFSSNETKIESRIAKGALDGIFIAPVILITAVLTTGWGILLLLSCIAGGAAVRATFKTPGVLKAEKECELGNGQENNSCECDDGCPCEGQCDNNCKCKSDCKKTD